MTPPTVSPLALYTNSRQKPPGATGILLLSLTVNVVAVLLMWAVLQ